MAIAKAYEVTLHDLDGLDEFPERRFIVNPGVRAFLAKDDQEHIVGVGMGRSSKALGHNKYYKAAEGNAWIESPTVSRRHAALSVDCSPPSLSLINVAATHGLFVNDNKIELGQHQVLNHTDIIQLSSEVKRGEETIPPRRFKIHFHLTSDTDTAEGPLVAKVFEVPEGSDDEAMDRDEDGNDDEVVYPDGSSEHSESPSSEDNDSVADDIDEETEIIMDSIKPAFSDLDSSEDEDGLDSDIAYGQGYDFSDEDMGIDSEAEHDVDFDQSSSPVSRDTNVEQANTANQSSPLDKLTEAHRLAIKSVWPDCLPAALHSQVSAPVIPQDTVLMETAPTTSESGPHDSVAGDNFEKSTPRSENDSQEADFLRRTKLSQMISQASKTMETPSAATLSNAYPADSMDRIVNSCDEACYNRPMATSMSIEHIIEPSNKETRPLMAPEIGQSFRQTFQDGQWTGQKLWSTMYNKAGNSFAPTLALDGTPNPWADELPLNDYQEGPFASDRIADKSKGPNDHGFDSSPCFTISSHPDFAITNHMTMRSGISIPDIVDTPKDTQPVAETRPLKRKNVDLESTEANKVSFDVCTDVARGPSTSIDKSSHEMVQSTTAPPNKAAGGSTSPTKKPRLSIDQPKAHAGHSSTRRRHAKRTRLQKVRSVLATASIGALVGGLTVFSALAFLPEAIFE